MPVMASEAAFVDPVEVAIWVALTFITGTGVG